jgi:hypothetical protein
MGEENSESEDASDKARGLAKSQRRGFTRVNEVEVEEEVDAKVAEEGLEEGVESLGS